MSEFNIIEKYFTWDNIVPSVIKGVGDDAALLNIPNDRNLVISVDTSIVGVHFPVETPAYDVGYKSLAVNLSDLAAMGASPAWFTLALTLPSKYSADDSLWLEGFSQGLKQLSQDSGCSLIGGDTTQGNLSITIQVMGLVDKGCALLRSGAKAGDLIYVTGTFGAAAAGLASLLYDFDIVDEADALYCQQRLNKPTARLKESKVIKQYASSCIDVSDGLLQDLGHILKASKVGAMVDTRNIPLAPALIRMDNKTAVNFALSGGDDYELLFTVTKENHDDFLNAVDFQVTCIGEITKNTGMLLNENGDQITATGYNHFNE